MSNQSNYRRSGQFNGGRSYNGSSRRRNHSGGYQGGGRHRHESGEGVIHAPGYDGVEYGHPISVSPPVPSSTMSPPPSMPVGGYQNADGRFEEGEILNPDAIYSWIKREQDKYQTLKENNEVLTGELRRLQDDNKTIANHNDKLRAEIYELERERNGKYEQFKQKFEKSEDALKEEARKLRGQLKQKQEKVDSLHRLVNRLNERNATLTKEEHEQRQVERKMKEKIAKLTEEHEQLTADNSKLQKSLEAKSVENDKLTAENGKMKENVAELLQFIDKRVADENKMIGAWNMYQTGSNLELTKYSDRFTEDINELRTGENAPANEENSQSVIANQDSAGPSAHPSSPAVSVISSTLESPEDRSNKRTNEDGNNGGAPTKRIRTFSGSVKDDDSDFNLSGIGSDVSSVSSDEVIPCYVSSRSEVKIQIIWNKYISLLVYTLY